MMSYLDWTKDEIELDTELEWMSKILSKPLELSATRAYKCLGALLTVPCNDQVLDIAKLYVKNESPEVRLASLTLISKFPRSQVENILAEFTGDSIESIRETAFYVLRR